MVPTHGQMGVGMSGMMATPGQYPGVGRGQYPPGAPGMPGGPHPGMGHGDYQGAMRGHAAMAGTMPTPGQMVPTHGQMGVGMSGMMATPGQAMEPPAKRAKTEGGHVRHDGHAGAGDGAPRQAR